MAETAYDTDNIFAKILRGEIPVAPRLRGRRRRRLHGCDAARAGPYAGGAQGAVTQPARRRSVNLRPAFHGRPEGGAGGQGRFEADGVTIMQFNEPASGQTVYHLHVHVIPRFDGIPLKPHTGGMEKPEVLAENAEKIRAALGS